MSFAERLKEARKKKGYTQEILAEIMGVSRQTITKWETETGFPEMQKTLQLAIQLQVSLDWLFEEELNKSAKNAFVNNGEDGNSLQHKDVMSLVNNVIDGIYGIKDKDIMLTHYKFFDRAYGGLARGSVYYVFENSENYISSLVINIVANLLRDNRSIMFALQENTLQIAMQQLICAIANIRAHIDDNEYSVEIDDKLKQAIDFIQKSKLIFDDSGDAKIEKTIENYINMQLEKLDLIVIDSARLFKSIEKDKDYQAKKKRLVRILENIAIENKCAILVFGAVDSDIMTLVQNYENADLIVKKYLRNSVLNDKNNFLFMQKSPYITLANSEEDCINIVYNNGFHTENRNYLYCKMNRETGKIFDYNNEPYAVIFAAASFYNVAPIRITERNRTPECIRLRKIVSYICNEKEYNSIETARCFEHMDQSVIIHNAFVLKDMMKTDPTIEEEINVIMKMI